MVAAAPEALVMDLVEWVNAKPRTYAEAMEAWRTSCPRLPVWEDAVDRGYVERSKSVAGEAMVAITPKGRAMLIESGRYALA